MSTMAESSTTEEVQSKSVTSNSADGDYRMRKNAHKKYGIDDNSPKVAPEDNTDNKQVKVKSSASKEL